MRTLTVATGTVLLAGSGVTAQTPVGREPQPRRVAAAEAPAQLVVPDARQRSPDGRRVAYARVTWVKRGDIYEPRYELVTEGTGGSEPQVHYSDSTVRLLLVHEWSRDGRYVVATAFLPHRSDFLLVTVASRSVRVLKTQARKTLNWSFQWSRMRISPDGRFVAYDASADGGWHPRDVFAVPVQGGAEIPLVRHAANDLLLDWTPDGRGILFASDRSGRWDLWVLPVVDARPIRGPPGLVKSNLGIAIDELAFRSLGFTADGSYYYSVATWETGLHVATLDPATSRLRDHATVATDVGYRTAVDWSRDGRYLAYVRGRGSPFEPFVLTMRDAETGTERRLRLVSLIRHGGHGFEPRWSPDGRFILVVARERDYGGPLLDSQGLYRIDVRTGSIAPFAQSGTICGADCAESPAWSPDGEVIFKRRMTSSIVTRSLETGEERELHRTVSPVQIRHWPTSNLAVSPDGRWVAFVSAPEGSTALLVLSTSGGEPRELLRVPEPEALTVPAWTSDSRHILYARGVSGDQRRFSVWRISAETGAADDLGLTIDARVPYGLSVHPDGKRIAFTAGTERRDEIWVLDNLVSK